MNEANKIIEEIKNEVSQLNKENKGGVLIPLKHFRIILDYIDNLQKELENLKEVDRQICCEELITKDKYQDILKENEELKEDNKKLNDLLMLGELDYISKDIIRNKIKELEEELDDDMFRYETMAAINVLKELLGE